MAIVADRRKTTEYVLQEDRKLARAKQTKWALRTLDATRALDVLDRVGKFAAEEVTADNVDVKDMVGAMRYACKVGIAGAAPLEKDSGDPVEFTFDDDGTLSDETLDLFSIPWLIELGGEILNQNTLGKTARGNS